MKRREHAERMTRFARGRLRILGAVLVVALGILVGTVVDARARIAAGRATLDRNAPIAAATGLSELALSTSSTWLRHPALAVPSAGASDAPLGLDVDPAGAAIPRHAHERVIEMHREAP